MKKISILILIVFLVNCIMPVALAVDANEVVENNTTVEDEIENGSTPEPTTSTEATTSPEPTESTEPSKEPVPTESIEPSIEPTETEEPQEEIQEEVEEENQIMLTAAGTQTIPDGKYKIKANVGSNMYLDIDAGSQSNCANVQIWQKSRVPQQEFQVTYLNNGYYSITAMHSQKVLDVSNGGMSSGTNIWQYQSNNTDAQQWVIKEVGNRKYNIISKLNGLCVDVYGAYGSNGTNVQTYQGNGSAAQQFTFEEVKEWQPKRTIKDGVYKIKANVGSNMCVDIDAGSKANEANVQIWSSNNVEQQKFQVTYLNNGYYKIIALHSGKALDVNNGGTANGTNVKQYSDTGSTAQQWVIQESGQHEGYYNVASRCNNLCLDIAGGIANNGTNVQMYDYNGTEAQEFKFDEVENVEATYTIAEGTYKIASALNENQVIDVDAGSHADGANVHIWQNQNVRQQIFSVKRIGGGLYTIEIPYSNKVLDVNNGGQTNGTNVKQDKANNGNAQKWIIKESEEKTGYYYIISKCNGIYLDVADGKANNDANIQMHEKFQDDSTRQLFKFIPYSSQEAPIIYDGSYRM